MLSTLKSWKQSLSARFQDHIQSPLLRNAYALIANIGITSGLGFIFWLVVARLYNVEVVGINSAAISSMMLVATLAGLNLKSAFNRFIPVSGASVRKFVSSVYGIVGLAALAIGLPFLLIQSALSTETKLLDLGWGFSIWFVISSAAWTLFVLQDSALIGFRKSVWVPIENGVFGIVKLILLFPFAYLFPQFGLFAAWTIPTLLIVFPVGYLIFARLIPDHMNTNVAMNTQLKLASIGQFVVVDYLGEILALMSSTILPLLIISLLNPEANAYFQIAWTIGYTPALIAVSMSQSLVAEIASEPSLAAVYVRQILIQMVRILVPVCLVIIIFAPAILWLFGGAYQQKSTAILRLIAIASIPASINILSIGIARSKSKLFYMLFPPALSSILTISLSVLLMTRIGLLGVGWAYLVGQTVVMLTTVPVYRSLRDK